MRLGFLRVQSKHGLSARHWTQTTNIAKRANLLSATRLCQRNDPAAQCFTRPFPAARPNQVDKLVRETDELIYLAQSKESKSSKKGMNDCNRVLESWTQIANKDKDITAAQKAQKLLDVIRLNMINSLSTSFIPKDSFPFSVVLRSYAQCNGGRQATLLAQSLFERMLEDCENYLIKEDKTKTMPPPEPCIYAYNHTLQA